MKFFESQAQQQASDIRQSVWLSASAGTGKTKVLVDRLFKLLINGTPLNHIVCLTFTKAAALEMRERLMDRLENASKQMNDESLLAARNLEDLIESPETLKIMTVHAFCQSLLQKFPFEAGITPFFKILDERETYDFLMRSLNTILLNPPNDHISEAITSLSLTFGEQTFQNCLLKACTRWQKLKQLEKKFPTSKAYGPFLSRYVFEHDQEDFPSFAYDQEMAQKVCLALSDFSNTTDQRMFEALKNLPPLEDLRTIFLKKDGQPRSRFVSSAFQKAHPTYALILKDWAEQCYQIVLKQQLMQWIEQNTQFWVILKAVLDHFCVLKEEEGVLDYHDLILHTLSLLSNEMELAHLYEKLDYTIDHILIDEAQDNSPEQWLLIYQLVDLFLRSDTNARTFFVVGDVKQSIYGFQGAEPELFLTLKDLFKTLLTERSHRFKDLSLKDSYRTTPEILTFVDQLFNNNQTNFSKGLGDDRVFHQPHRKDQGWIHLHHVDFENEDIEDDTVQQDSTMEHFARETAWNYGHDYSRRISQDQQLAHKIAEDVCTLLQSKWIVPSTGAPVAAKDILILVRSRGNLCQLIMQSLKNRGVLTEGLDRISLLERQAIQDILALMRFLNLPSDDESLVHVLKSPLINEGHGLSEDLIFKLCHDRKGSVFEVLSRNYHGQIPDGFYSIDECASLNFAFETLKGWLDLVDYTTNYSLLNQIIQKNKSHFIKRLGEGADLLFEAFLDDVYQRQSQYPTLSSLLSIIDKKLSEVKRDSTRPQGVRIMTIHGSKGLEAPCVFLVDRKERFDLTKESVLWPIIEDQTEGQSVDFFCLRPPSTLKGTILDRLRHQTLEKLKNEQNRLLYVALTRARDGLWVIGSGSWVKAFDDLLKRYSFNSFQTVLDLQRQSLQKEKEQETLVEAEVCRRFDDLPLWFEQQMITDQKIHHQTDLLKHQEAIANSEHSLKTECLMLNKDTSLWDNPPNSSLVSANERGILIHRAFELLLKHGHTVSIKQYFLNFLKLDPLDLEKILWIYNHPRCQAYFATALNFGQEVEFMTAQGDGRVDHVVINENQIIIVDFKTGKRGALEQRIEYDRQLSAYAQAFKDLYPMKSLQKVLLWFDEPMIELLPDHL